MTIIGSAMQCKVAVPVCDYVTSVSH
jgi:hypothetical protein